MISYKKELIDQKGIKESSKFDFLEFYDFFDTNKYVHHTISVETRIIISKEIIRLLEIPR
jgi:hypothetical protein